MFQILLAVSPSPSPSSAAATSGGGWAVVSVLVSVATALGVSGLVAGAVSSRQQRIRDRREALLAASDDFLSASARAGAVLQNLKPPEDAPDISWLIGEITQSPEDPEDDLSEELDRSLHERVIKETRTATEAAGTALADVAAKIRRVELLFGPDTTTAQLARSSLISLKDATFTIVSCYRAYVDKEGSKEPDFFDKALPVLGHYFGSTYPDWKDLIDVTWRAGGRGVDILQERSFKRGRGKALAVYDDKAKKAGESLEEFVRSACAEIRRLENPPLLPRPAPLSIAISFSAVLVLGGFLIGLINTGTITRNIVAETVSSLWAILAVTTGFYFARRSAVGGPDGGQAGSGALMEDRPETEKLQVS